MSIRNTPRKPDDTAGAARPGPLDRVTSMVAWYTPELTGAAAAGAAAATVWAPLGAISAALGAWIATDQVNLARARRRARREVEQRTERAQLNAAEYNGERGEHPAHDLAGEAEPDADPAADERRSGWEVAG